MMPSSKLVRGSWVLVAASLLACSGDAGSEVPQEAGSSGRAGKGGSAQATGGGAGQSGSAGSVAAGAAGQAGVAGGGGGAGAGGNGGEGGGSGTCAPGSFECDQDALRMCNPQTGEFETIETCEPGLCDAKAGACAQCVPLDVLGCEGGSGVVRCGADGFNQEVLLCPAQAPFCVGEGTCVACRDVTDCPVSQEECYQAACVSGACSKAPKAKDWPASVDPDGCSVRTCDGAGGVIEKNLDAGQACQGGVCNGIGGCGECTPNATECMSGESIRTCNAQGVWEGEMCPQDKPACHAGACQGVDEMVTGNGFSCARLEYGSVRCWGKFLGYGQVPAEIGQLEGVVQIVAGVDHVCALTSDGTLWCHGNNYYGQLGIGSASSPVDVSKAPVKITSLKTVISVAAGAHHTCATDEGGSVWCWGDNTSGQVLPGQLGKVLSPSKIGSLGGVAKLSLGDEHSCALTKTGEVFCWGSNDWGQVGYGGGKGVVGVTKAKLTGTAINLFAGPHHQAAIVTLSDSKQEFRRWGAYGEIKEEAWGVPSPVYFGGIPKKGFISFTTFVSAKGLENQLSIVGKNAMGHLGNGSTSLDYSSSAFNSSFGHTWGGVAMSLGHICAWEDKGRALCWGDNSYGQSAPGSADKKVFVPTEVKW